MDFIVSEWGVCTRVRGIVIEYMYVCTPVRKDS